METLREMGLSTPVAVYALGWLIAFVCINVSWSRGRREDKYDEDYEEPVTFVDKVVALLIRVGGTALIAWLWPGFVFAAVWGGAEWLFKRGR